MEAQPDKWFRGDMYTAVEAGRAAIARYVNAAKDDVVFVPNASHGVNAVLRSILIGKEDRVLFLNLAYTMVKNTFSYLQGTFGDQMIVVNISFPTSADAIVAAVEEQLSTFPQGSVKLASFSHITSVPSLILPVKRLAAVCHAHGTLVLVDGAHALGHIPLDIPSIGADFYVGNGHKWLVTAKLCMRLVFDHVVSRRLYSLKGSAILWVAKKSQSLVSPTVISLEGRGPSRFVMAFSWEGTADKSSYLSVSAALAFRNSLGEEALMNYTHELAVQGILRSLCDHFVSKVEFIMVFLRGCAFGF